MIVVEPFRDGQTAVLLSGGLDSAVLVAHAARTARVHPVYVSTGLAWEAAERTLLSRLLAAAPFRARVEPLVSLSLEMRDVYGPDHWAVVGTPPGFDTPDEDVYLPGRNIVLFSKASVYCARQGIGRIALGLLAGNPFPDASPAFLAAMGDALSRGLDTPLVLDAPLSAMHKADVIRLGVELGVPLELTLSCMQPIADGQGAEPARGIDALHCGQCSKCRERRDGFIEAGVRDPTSYARVPAR